MVYRYALWQQALGMLMWGLFSVGVLVPFYVLFQVLLRRPSASPKKDLKIAAGALLGGFLLYLLFWKIGQPQVIPVSDSINTPQHFRRAF